MRRVAATCGRHWSHRPRRSTLKKTASITQGNIRGFVNNARGEATAAVCARRKQEGSTATEGSAGWTALKPSQRTQLKIGITTVVENAAEVAFARSINREACHCVGRGLGRKRTPNTPMVQRKSGRGGGVAPRHVAPRGGRSGQVHSHKLPKAHACGGQVCLVDVQGIGAPVTAVVWLHNRTRVDFAQIIANVSAALNLRRKRR